MKTTTTKTQFRDTFHEMGRGDNFSYYGLGALFDYMEEYEESCGEEIEFDCIALCCDYSEHDSAVECVSDHGYSLDYEEYQDDEKEEIALEYLRGNTSVVEFEGGIIIQAF